MNRRFLNFPALVRSCNFKQELDADGFYLALKKNQRDQSIDQTIPRDQLQNFVVDFKQGAFKQDDSIVCINLSGCEIVSDEILIGLLDAHKRVEVLIVKGNLLLTDVGLSSVNTASIRHLDISHCILLTDSGLSDITTKASKLEYLNLSCCYEISDTSILQTANHLTNITHLDLSGLSNLSDKSIAMVIEQLVNLVHLNLSGLAKITDVSFKSLSREEVKSAIKNISLVADWSLTNQTLMYLSNCKLLESLNIAGCRQITDEGLTHFLKTNGKALQILNVTGCLELTDQSLQSIYNNCNSLKHCTLTGCSKLSYFEVNDFVDNYRHLDVTVVKPGDVTSTMDFGMEIDPTLYAQLKNGLVKYSALLAVVVYLTTNVFCIVRASFWLYAIGMAIILMVLYMVMALILLVVTSGM